MFLTQESNQGLLHCRWVCESPKFLKWALNSWTFFPYLFFYLKLFWRRQWHPTPVLLPGKSHGRRSLVGCSPCGRQESDTTERLHFHFSLSCIGEGTGNPLQCSCLENPRDGGACGLPSMGSHRVRHDWSDLAAAERGHLVMFKFPRVQYIWNLRVWALQSLNMWGFS